MAQVNPTFCLGLHRHSPTLLSEMVRETQSDVTPAQEPFSSTVILDTAPRRRGRPPRKENNEILEDNHLLNVDSPQSHNPVVSIHHQHPHLLGSTTGISTPFHQLSGMIEDEEAEKEASNDEFEPLSSELAPLRKRVSKSAKNSAISTSSLTNSETRRAKRASGEHLWKHRCFWDEEETEYLKEGVRKYGRGKWKAILSDPAFKFKDRSSVDLKDKWRNLETFVPWSDHEIRKYILLDESHAPYRTTTSNFHIFQNRWPRDAALKVASRDEFYPLGPDDNTPFLIYLREIRSADPTTTYSGELSSQLVSEEEQVVHVYEGTRERRVAADIEKFQNKRFMWVPSVVKLRTEKLSYGRKSTSVALPSNIPSVSISSSGLMEMLLPQL